jgi:hypothetical protein
MPYNNRHNRSSSSNCAQVDRYLVWTQPCGIGCRFLSWQIHAGEDREDCRGDNSSQSTRSLKEACRLITQMWPRSRVRSHLRTLGPCRVDTLGPCRVGAMPAILTKTFSSQPPQILTLKP